jgi:L-fuculose-phosphate aldolase
MADARAQASAPTRGKAPRRGADLALRRALVATGQRLDSLGLNRGSTGNVSVRASGGGFWVTPTGMGAAQLTAEALVWLSDDGQEVHGDWAPSSEWPFHASIYRARPDLHGIVHVHSVHATALASLRQRLPSFHYMVAVAGGDDVPCVPYEMFGTEALSSAVAKAFATRNAALLANHGLVAAGRDLPQALKVCTEVEALCESYLKACAVGAPALLSKAQMKAVIERFKSYGQTRRAPAKLPATSPPRPVQKPKRATR